MDSKDLTKTQIRNQQKEGFAKNFSNLQNNKKKDSAKRYSYLLGQTDLFRHFLNLQEKKGVDVSEFNSEQNVSQGRKTEVQEDEELLNEDENENFDDEPIVLTESPSC